MTANWERVESAGAEKGILCQFQGLCRDSEFSVAIECVRCCVVTWPSVLRHGPQARLHDRHPARATGGSGLLLSIVHGHYSQMFFFKKKTLRIWGVTSWYQSLGMR